MWLTCNWFKLKQVKEVRLGALKLHRGVEGCSVLVFHYMTITRKYNGEEIEMALGNFYLVIGVNKEVMIWCVV